MFHSRGGSWTGLDRIFLLLGLSTIIQFGPMLSATIHVGHGVYSYTQVVETVRYTRTTGIHR